MNESTRWLVIHWGSRGGGPEFMRGATEGLVAQPAVEVFISYAADADIAQRLELLVPEENRFVVRTYRNARQLVTGLPRLLVYALRLRRWIRRNGIDYVYAPMFSIWQSLALPLWKPRGVVYLSSVHDATEHPGDDHVIKRLCYRIETQASDITVTYSSDVDRRWSNLHPGARTLRLWHGVEAEVATPRYLKSGTLVALFFGRILAYKGIELFVNALSVARANGVPVVGEVWGSAPDTYDLSAPVGVSTASGTVRWHLGWVSEHEVRQAFATADIVILPYIEASQSGVLALAAGQALPAVITPVGGLVEQAGQYGNAAVASGVSAPAVARALGEVLTDARLYRTLSEHAIAFVQRRSWGQFASELVQRAREMSCASERGDR